MRIAALYDIHGNLPALEAVLTDVRACGVDHIVIGGDVVPGPMPRESLALIARLELPTSCISGNGEREILAIVDGVDTGTVPAPFRDSMRWVAEQLDAEAIATLRSWPPTTRVSLPMGDVLFCHATPRNDTDIFTRLTPADHLTPIVALADAAIVVCGHTHMQFDRMVGDVRVVNAGSVGMPFQEAGAYWLLLGDDVELRRTSYDLAAAAARVRDTSYPQADDFATRNILQPPTEEAMLAAFAGITLS